MTPDRISAIEAAYPRARVVAWHEGRVGVAIVELASGGRVAVKAGFEAHHDVELAHEATILRLLSGDSGAPRLIDEVTIGGRRALVLAQLPGRTVVLIAGDSGRADPAEVLPALADVARTLGRLHALGFVHGDVKSDNVLLDGRHGFLVDFALAKRVGTAIAGTQVVSIPYLSPETCVAPAVFDPAYDLYALGVVLYEALCGARPFATATSLLEQHRVASAPFPAVLLRPDLGADVLTVIEAAISARPHERPHTATDFSDRLDALSPVATLSSSNRGRP